MAACACTQKSSRELLPAPSVPRQIDDTSCSPRSRTNVHGWPPCSPRHPATSSGSAAVRAKARRASPAGGGQRRLRASSIRSRLVLGASRIACVGVGARASRTSGSVRASSGSVASTACPGPASSHVCELGFCQCESHRAGSRCSRPRRAARRAARRRPSVSRPLRRSGAAGDACAVRGGGGRPRPSSSTSYELFAKVSSNVLAAACTKDIICCRTARWIAASPYKAVHISLLRSAQTHHLLAQRRRSRLSCSTSEVMPPYAPSSGAPFRGVAVLEPLAGRRPRPDERRRGGSTLVGVHFGPDAPLDPALQLGRRHRPRQRNDPSGWRKP